MEAGKYTARRRNHPSISAGRAARHVPESDIAASIHGVPSVLGISPRHVQEVPSRPHWTARGHWRSNHRCSGWAVATPGTASRDRLSRSYGSQAVAALGAGANTDPRPRVQTQGSIASCRQEACPCARASPASIHPAGVSPRARETAKRIRDTRVRPFGTAAVNAGKRPSWIRTLPARSPPNRARIRSLTGL